MKQFLYISCEENEYGSINKFHKICNIEFKTNKNFETILETAGKEKLIQLDEMLLFRMDKLIGNLLMELGV